MNFFKKNDSIPAANDLRTPVLTVSSTGEILFANTAAKEILSAVEGKKITDYVNTTFPDIVAGEHENVENAVCSKLDENIFLTIKSKRFGENKIVEMNEVSEIYKERRDLTEYKKNSENENENKNLFLAQTANLLKSPMHSIMGYSRAITEGMGGAVDEHQLKYLNIIYKNSSELFGVIEKITELSAIEAGLTEYSPKNFDLNNLLISVTYDYEGRDENKNVKLVTDTEDLIRKVVFSDETVLRRILDNLLKNALLSCEFGNISISLSDKEFVEKDEKFTRITVTDSGTGIKDEDIPNIFNPYINPDRKNKTALIKSLSLACAKKLVEFLGGTISVVNSGKSFTFVIPAGKERA